MSTTIAYPASKKQIYWIGKKLDEAQVDPAVGAEIKRQLDAGMTKRQAGSWLDLLFSLPDKPIEGHTPVTEAGLYMHDGDIYKAVQSKTGNFYAKKLEVRESGRSPYVYAGGAIRRIDANEKLTAEQAQQFGLTTGVCANCGERLEDPISLEIGLGTHCGPKLMGRADYNAARKAAKAKPEVAQAIAAREARKAEAEATAS